MKYIRVINGDRVGLYFGFGFGFGLGKALVAFVLPKSIEDHPLLWMVFRSQTYYPKHILTYGSGKARCSLVMGSGSF